MTNTVIVIPARFSSTRLPGKPLTLIAGKPMVERVWQLASQIERVSRIVVATDDERIAEAVRNFGGEAVMTPVECKNGTERTLAAIDALAISPDVIVNLQGDAPVTPPWVVQAMVDTMANTSSDICTPAIKLSGASARKFLQEKTITPASGTTVVMNKNGDAMYFSKTVLPFSRSGDTDIYRHIGLYAYRTDVLKALMKLPEGQLEKTERLEQLRALENGYSIRIAVVDYRGRSHASVDAPEDVARVEEIIKNEGELVAN